MRKIDCFMFGLEYELDLLELRLEYLWDTIDYFVLVEANFDQNGRPKKLYFRENHERFARFREKILSIELTGPLTEKSGTWENENFQRNAIANGLNRLNILEHDIIVLSDLDEIPNKDAIKKFIAEDVKAETVLEQDMFYYFLNMKASYKWRGSQISRGGYYLSSGTPQALRNRRNEMPVLPAHGGWHFSYIGGPKAVIQKINSVCESAAHEEFNNLDIIRNYQDVGILHFNNARLQKINIFEELYPENFRERSLELNSKGLIQK